MSQPADATLKDWAKTLDGIAFKPLIDKLIVYRRRDQEQAIADGYPGSTLGGGRGGSELTPTEAAAELRLRGQSDPIHDAVCAALDMLAQAVSSANAVGNLVAKLDKLAGEEPPLITHCEPCKLAGVLHPPAHTSNLGGKVTTTMDVCEPIRKYVDTQSLPRWVKDHPGRLPAWRDVLPTPEQIRWHESHGNWRVYVGTNWRGTETDRVITG